MQDFEMTPDEQMSAINKLTVDIEEDFVQLGQLLTKVKKTKLFKFKGYKTFGEFVENEFNLSGAFASKLLSNYGLFIEEMDIDEMKIKQVGLDKLNIIKPIVKSAETSYEDSVEWINRAAEIPAAELRAEVKEVRDKNKKDSLSLKEVFVDQYIEKMTTFFNCNRKELDFKLALYFQDRSLDDIKGEITIAKRRFEEQDQ